MFFVFADNGFYNMHFFGLDATMLKHDIRFLAADDHFLLFLFFAGHTKTFSILLDCKYYGVPYTHAI